MKKTRFVLMLALPLIPVVGLNSLCQAAPVQWKIENGGNGHYYNAVPAAINWYDACDAAKNSEFTGYHGHLATITSAGENEFIVNNFPTAYYNGYWLGGFQPPGSEEPAGGWQWVTGEPWDYTFWANGEPSNANLMPGQPPEDGLIFRDDPAYTFGSWNDWYRAGIRSNGGYVVEYPVPEPCTVVLLGLGALAAMRRRRA